MILRLMLLPMRLGSSAVWLAARVGFKAGRISAKGGRVAGRRIGWGKVALFATGVAVGLLLSIVPGGYMRRKLASLVKAGSVHDSELCDRVVFELAHSPRTWHLAQPQVTVDDGVIRLRGEVPDRASADALEKVARAVPGVVDVTSELTSSS